MGMLKDTHQDMSLDSLDQIERVDPVELYATMRPDQRTAIGNEFVRYLTLAGDPMAEQLRPKVVDEAMERGGEAARGTTEPKPAAMLSAEEVARMHVYARDQRHDVFERVMEHPVTRASLERRGQAPTGTDEGLEAAQVQPEVDVPTTLDKASILHP
jgi:hypothetical protein